MRLGSTRFLQLRILFLHATLSTAVKNFIKHYDRGIIVRHFKSPRIENFLRITVGTDEQCNELVTALTEILRLG